MNIQELHNRLIKKANITKLPKTSPLYRPTAADKLREAIANVNKVRSDKKVVKQLLNANWDSSGALHSAISPFISHRRAYSLSTNLERLKSPLVYNDANLNKLIDRINKFIDDRTERIRRLRGEDAAERFEQRIINKYVKDIPEKYYSQLRDRPLPFMNKKTSI